MRCALQIAAVALLALLGLGSVQAQVPAGPEQATVRHLAAPTIYFFGSRSCPHCARAREFLGALARRGAAFRLELYDVDGDDRNAAAFIALSRHFGNDPPAVPLIAIGDQAFVGYRDDASTGAEIERRVTSCLASSCADIAGPIISHAIADVTQGGTSPEGAGIVRPEVPKQIQIPGFGTIETRTLSLPALTIVLAAVDGFNPCAMWVLVFLIGLLIGMNDPVRMWSYGAVFLLTSGAVYLVFMAAWLNVFLLLGTLAWIRAAVGVFALVAGSYYLREFVRNPDATCNISSPGGKQRVMDRLKAAVAERSFLVAIIGIMGLAIAVNMIELLCSAGIPAVYTQVLALSDLSRTSYFAYLALYIAVFMLDDAAIFIAAMLTLQATGLATSYSRWSHLIGGGVLLGVGLLLIFKPEWLALA